MYISDPISVLPKPMVLNINTVALMTECLLPWCLLKTLKQVWRGYETAKRKKISKKDKK